jgi:hypothetical protein
MASHYWTSKLGNKYLRAEIEDNEQRTKAELDLIRNLQENRQCADCGQNHTVWASVNIGIFLCLRCASIHRGIGTHISIPKGCNGTYHWGPDEIERMRSWGNKRASEVYGGDEFRPQLDDSDESWRQYIIAKYEHQKFVCSNSVHIHHSIGDLTHSGTTKTIHKEGTVIQNNNSTLNQRKKNTLDFTHHQVDLMIFEEEEKETENANGRLIDNKEEDFFAQFGL